MSGGVPPSSRAGKRVRVNASNPEVRKAISLYQRFTGHKVDPDECEIVKAPPTPKVLTVIGDIDGVLYTTVRDGKVEKYIHQFHKNDKPIFAVSPNGKQLFMLGGAYDFTERGIVDRSDKSR